MPNQARLGEAKGIDLLLTCAAQYKSKDPGPGACGSGSLRDCPRLACPCRGLLRPAAWPERAFVPPLSSPAPPCPGEEEEYVQNVFDVLCACLMQPEHRAAFVKARAGRSPRTVTVLRSAMQPRGS